MDFHDLNIVIEARMKYLFLTFKTVRRFIHKTHDRRLNAVITKILILNVRERQ